MTLQHLLRTLLVAGAGAAALAFASHARAEGGEESSIYTSGVPAVTPTVEEAASSDEQAPTDSAAAAEEAPPSTDERGPKRMRAAIDARKAVLLKPLIARHASENGVPFELADAIVRLESRYNAAARNGANIGLMQINARTAQALGYQGSAAGLKDPETNLRYGVKYLAQAYKLAGGDTCGTILRYHAGHRAEGMTKAASAYCSKVKILLARDG